MYQVRLQQHKSNKLYKSRPYMGEFAPMYEAACATDVADFLWSRLGITDITSAAWDQLGIPRPVDHTSHLTIQLGEVIYDGEIRQLPSIRYIKTQSGWVWDRTITPHIREIQ